ncbi:MAG: PGAP1 family protein [uncultured bacterium]|nr:MAG: PGAP1 family protein [uncultured bacterium]
MTIKGEVVINEGAVLEIKKGVKVSFEGWSGIVAKGNLIVKGTVKEPVIFKQGNGWSEYSIEIRSGGKAKFRNADISGGGAIPGILMHNDKFIAKTASASFESAIYVRNGGNFEADGLNLHDNYAGIYVENVPYYSEVKANRSKFFSNDAYDVIYAKNSVNNLDFKYNWWGYPDGPKKLFYGSVQYGYEKIRGSVDFSDWADKEDFHDPVIIIPGILGSQKKDGQWQIDPVFHTYDNLYDEFADNGYVPEEDLFKFPYEWRDSNADGAKLLKDKINEIKIQTDWPKVDVVAHSMGGLLSREYVESDYYQSDVDQLVTLGTPHNGAPEAYLKWEGDKWFWSLGDIYTKNIIKQEAEEGGYADIFDYIHQRPVASLEELLPVYDYLQEVDNDYAYRIYPEGYPRNEFLENLNSEEKKNKLKDIEFDKIIGGLGNENITIAGFKIIDVDMGKKWEHGYPHGLEIPILGDESMFYSDGDKTVPLSSGRSENIPADYLIEINSDHRDLPTEAQSDVLELLTGERPETEKRNSLVKNILMVSVFSPIDIQIIAPDGKRVGKDFETGEIINEIDGAYYTGFETENEFITIPNPEDGEYEIATQGTGVGEYRVEVTKISEDEENTFEAKESTAVFEGIAEEGKIKEAQIEIAGDEVLGEKKDEIAPVIVINSPENKRYLNSGGLELNFDVTDDVSAKGNIAVKKYLDGVETEADAIADLSLEKTGTHIFAVEAVDEAGNTVRSEANFEIITDFTTLISNVGHYGEMGMIRKQEVKALKNIIGNISRLEKVSKLVEKSEYIKTKDKKKIAETIDRMIIKHVDSVIMLIGKKPEKFISADAKDVLIGSLEYIVLN